MKHLTAFLALLSIACAGAPLAPDVDPATIAVEFAARVAGFNDPAATSVSGGNREITIRGSIFTGQHGYELSPALTSDRGLHLLVTAVSGPGITIGAHYRYEARLQGLPPGRHALSVVHHVPGESEPRTAFDGVVTVR